jgi:hypothetical protein
VDQGGVIEQRQDVDQEKQVCDLAALDGVLQIDARRAVAQPLERNLRRQSGFDRQIGIGKLDQSLRACRCVERAACILRKTPEEQRCCRGIAGGEPVHDGGPNSLEQTRPDNFSQHAARRMLADISRRIGHCGKQCPRCRLALEGREQSHRFPSNVLVGRSEVCRHGRHDCVSEPDQGARAARVAFANSGEYSLDLRRDVVIAGHGSVSSDCADCEGGNSRDEPEQVQGVKFRTG